MRSFPPGAAALVLLLAGPPAGAQAPDPVTPLLGTWVGYAVHRGDSAVVALTLAARSDTLVAASVSLPVIHVRDVLFGRVRRSGSSVQAGPFALAWDSAAGTLAGVLPDAIVAVHRIPIVFRRGTLPPAPERPGAGVGVRDPVWTYDAGSPIWGDLAAAGDLVFVGGDDGRLHAIDVRSGTARWTFQAGGPIRARPTPAGDALFVHADDGFLYRLDAAGGAERWRVRTTTDSIVRVPPPRPESRWDTRGSGVAMAGGRVYVGTHNGTVLALDAADGTRAWEFTAGGSVIATPAVADGRVFAGSFDGKVYALDASTGVLLWAHDAGAPVTSTPTPAGGVVVAGSRSYDLFGLEAATGAVRWNRYVWFSWIESTPAVRDGIAYVGSSDAARVTAVDAATGRRVWGSDVLGSAWGTPVVTDGAVFVGTRGQAGAFAHAAGVVALDRATGGMRWRYPMAAPSGAASTGFAGSAAMARGRVVFGAVDGRVYAFDAAP